VHLSMLGEFLVGDDIVGPVQLIIAGSPLLLCVGFCMQYLISVSLPARKLLNADLLARC
jgi:hypothetical protein